MVRDTVPTSISPFVLVNGNTLNVGSTPLIVMHCSREEGCTEGRVFIDILLLKISK